MIAWRCLGIASVVFSSVRCATPSEPAKSGSLDGAPASAIDSGAGGRPPTVVDATSVPDEGDGGEDIDAGALPNTSESDGGCGVSLAWNVDAASGQAACQRTLDTSCCGFEQTCARGGGCGQLVGCINACPRVRNTRSDTCINACGASASESAVADLSTLASCSKDAGVVCSWP